jgi:hypothetical protein
MQQGSSNEGKVYGGNSSPGSWNATALQGVARRVDANAHKLSEVVRLVDRHESLLIGDPATPGLLVRLDRIERSLSWFRWLATGGLAGVLGTILLLAEILKALQG